MSDRRPTLPWLLLSLAAWAGPAARADVAPEHFGTGPVSKGSHFSRSPDDPQSRVGLPTDLVLQGALTESDVKKGLLRSLGEIRHCHQTLVDQDPGRAGRLHLRLEVAPDGTVRSASAGDALGDADLAACVVRALSRASFHPPGPAGGRITGTMPLRVVFRGEVNEGPAEPDARPASPDAGAAVDAGAPQPKPKR
jgi:TonB family protein